MAIMYHKSNNKGRRSIKEVFPLRTSRVFHNTGYF